MAILSAQITLEELGVATASIESTLPYSVYDPIEVINPATLNVIATLMVTKCIEGHGGLPYQITAQDPMSALTQGSVILPSTNMGVLDVLSAIIESDYGQLFETTLTTDAEFAPQDTGDDEEVEPDEVDWNNLVRTVERLCNAAMTWQADAVYRLAAGTDRGVVPDSIMLSSNVAPSDKYANRIIVRCSGEWRSDPGAESTADETIRGGIMSVTRYGEQIREISVDSGGIYYLETFTYDENSRLTQHVATVITAVPSGTKYKTTTTRAWTITDEANYTYTETTITQKMGYWESEYQNLTKREVTTEVTDGKVEETAKGYGWNTGDAAWNPLITEDSMTVTRGFPGQPGINEYGIKETYKYWFDTGRSEWTYEQVKSEAITTAPSAPGYSTVLPLTKHLVNYCSVADDTTAQTTLGLKQDTLSIQCINDDTGTMDYINAISGNELARRGMARGLVCSLPLTTAEAWLPGDTFVWQGLAWSIRTISKDLGSMTAGISAVGQASIAYLKKALVSAYDQNGLAIIGTIRKENRAYDNVQIATIVSQADYETWVVRLSNGSIKLAKLQYGSGMLLQPGAVVTLMRESG